MFQRFAIRFASVALVAVLSVTACKKKPAGGLKLGPEMFVDDELPYKAADYVDAAANIDDTKEGLERLKALPPPMEIP